MQVYFISFVKVFGLSSIDLNLYTIDSFYFHCFHTNLNKSCYRNFHICFVLVVGYDVNNYVFYVELFFDPFLEYFGLILVFDVFFFSYV